METPYDDLISQAMQLPYDLRFELATQLNESLHPLGEDLTHEEWLAAWMPELKRRMVQSDAGEPGIPADDVLAELRDRAHGSSNG
jgi:hypothetical protein